MDVVALDLITRADVVQSQCISAVPEHNSTTTTAVIYFLMVNGVSCHCVVAVHFWCQHIARD